MTVEEPGSYRVFADFKRQGTNETLAGDLTVAGAAAQRPLPAPATTATADSGYKVAVNGAHSTAGRETELSFTVTRGGKTVKTERYLGADGHLVDLRRGDLAFLHVHPNDQASGHGDAGHGRAVRFMTEFPTADTHRRFLQFKHRGTVHTAAFTRSVSQ